MDGLGQTFKASHQAQFFAADAAGCTKAVARTEIDGADVCIWNMLFQQGFKAFRHDTIPHVRAEFQIENTNCKHMVHDLSDKR